MLGFLNGLSIVIFLSQWELFKVNGAWLPSLDLVIMLGFVIITMAIIHLFLKINKTTLASLVAIIVMTIVAVVFDRTGYHLPNVQDFAGMELKSELTKFYIPKVPETFEILKIIDPYAMIAALVGLTEAVLTLRVIDEMTDTRGDSNKECLAQGVANTVNGFFGGMGGDAMIGQSIINTKSGGRTRLSGLTASFSLLMFIMFGSRLINVIPLAALVGVMFMVVVGTFEWQSLRYANKIPKSDIIVIIAVSLITIFADLATAVIVGVIISALIFAWEKGKIIYVNLEHNEDGTKTYKINGSIFFGSVETYKELFDIHNDPDHIYVDFKYAKVMAHSAIEGINAIAQRYLDIGKKMTLIRLNEPSYKLFKNAKELTVVDIDETSVIATKYQPDNNK